MTYLKIEFCGVAGYYRCDLSQASSPLESWNGTDWVGTQHQCADCRHRKDIMLDLAFELEASEHEIAEDEFEAEYEFIDNFGYKISDANAVEYCDDFAEAVNTIANWYSDIDEWADGNGDSKLKAYIESEIEDIAKPGDGYWVENGALDTLKEYASDICEAVAAAMGAESFAGHGNYNVSAADRLGISLTIAENTNP